MRLIAITFITALVGCAAVDINKPGIRVSGLVPGSEARRLMQSNTVAEAGERGDCASQYTADSTLVSSGSDGVSVNCGGYGQGGYGGYSGSSREAQQSQLDNPDFGTSYGQDSSVPAPAPSAKKKAPSQAQKQELDETEAILDARRKQAAKEAVEEKK